jgi:DNA replication protein DnaC
MIQSMNEILERKIIAQEIKQILRQFDSNCNNVNFKKGIYIYGSPGCGKTQFVMNILKEMNYIRIYFISKFITCPNK